jgi:hypothetical protein
MSESFGSHSREPVAARGLCKPWSRRRRGVSGYAALGEDRVARRLLDRIGEGDDPTAVDIAACDGVTGSNTLAFYEQGWRGLAVEGDPERFASMARAYRDKDRVVLARAWVTPANVGDLLAAAGIPTAFAFLNLDIDSYDHDVLEALLARHRPRLVCAEINEKIPPPLRFCVRFAPDHVWQVDHFYGQSIATLHDLCLRNQYALVELHYNNAFLIPLELGVPSVGPEEAYRVGYLDRPDRLRLFPWNADMEPLQALPIDEQLAFVRRKFAAYEGRYDLGA